MRYMEEIPFDLANLFSKSDRIGEQLNCCKVVKELFKKLQCAFLFLVKTGKHGSRDLVTSRKTPDCKQQQH